MTLEELFEQIRSMEQYPIRVESASERNESLTFVGTLTEYLQAVKTGGSGIVFVSTTTLSLEDFLHQVEEVEQDAEFEEEPVDLCTVLPKLSGLKKKLGVVGRFDLSGSVATTKLTFAVVEDWWNEFVGLHYEARQILKERRIAELAELDAVEEERAHRVLQKLRALIDDKQFICLPTQRAMRAYALEKWPELEAVNEDDLKREIQDLSAKIHARGLGRKQA